MPLSALVTIICAMPKTGAVILCLSLLIAAIGFLVSRFFLGRRFFGGSFFLRRSLFSSCFFLAGAFLAVAFFFAGAFSSTGALSTSAGRFLPRPGAQFLRPETQPLRLVQQPLSHQSFQPAQAHWPARPLREVHQKRGSGGRRGVFYRRIHCLSNFCRGRFVDFNKFAVTARRTMTFCAFNASIGNGRSVS